MTKFIHFPASTNEVKTLIEGFDNYWGFPQCIGAIDGCHIPVSSPKLHAVDYYNYKGWYSTVLLAVCDYKYRFIYINVGAPGRNNDSHLYNSSQLPKLLSHLNRDLERQIIDTIMPPFLIGDSAFPLSVNLMKPFPNSQSLTHTQKNFNRQLSSARSVIENAFGRLKGRFRIV